MTYIGKVNQIRYKALRLTPTITGVQYANNDILFDTAEMANAVESPGGASKLVNVSLWTKSNDVFDIELLFFQVNQSMGTVNDARNVSDADWATAKYLGHLVLDGSEEDYNYGGGRIFTFAERPALPIVLQAETGSTSVYCAAFLSGTDVTPSFSVGDIELVFGLEL